MDRNWERLQIEKLVKKQALKIAELEKVLEKEHETNIKNLEASIELKKKENQQNNINPE
jgi:hypothetical protein